MEELIFFAVIILFSIFESIARSRKKRAGGIPQIPGDQMPSGGPSYDAPTYETHSYDQDLSYDDVAVEEYPTSSKKPALRTGSEGMIPADLWEEIAGLAESVKKQKARPAPPPLPPEVLPARIGWGKRVPKVGQQHRVHLAHVGYGTDPSERAPSVHDDLDPLARRLSVDVREVRQQLRRGRHALRQAVMLQEVLGPPVSMRPEARLGADAGSSSSPTSPPAPSS